MPVATGEAERCLSDNAKTVLERRYLRRTGGEVSETPDEMFWRVARAIAGADVECGTGADVEGITAQFYRLMASLDFLPNSPTLMNAGTEMGQLSACFVLPLDDDMTSIFDAVKATALINQSGGGTGFGFSHLRPSGDVVGSTGGVASGPVSFMRVFDTSTDVIKQGGRRRGANMGILRVDHPDILAFIDCKEQEGAFGNFNISVGITEGFMQALESDGEYELINPRTGKVADRQRARDVFDKIVDGAWRNGEPGIIFLDRMNEFSPTPTLGSIESVNPCGEQPLLALESCNLGSINLSRMLTPEGGLNWQKLERTVRVAVRFLDDVITANRYPLPEIEKATLLTRKIGLGVMGFADLLVKLGIPYDSEEAEAVAEKVMEAISFWSKEESSSLAGLRGSFPAFDESIYAQGQLPLQERLEVDSCNLPPCLADVPYLDWEALKQRVQERGIRNATTTTIAPTGSISIIAGTTGGIEPLFALTYTRRHVLNEDELTQANPVFESLARERGFYSAELMREVGRRGGIQDLGDIPADVRRLFVTAHDITPEWHVRMQSAYQRYVDNAVSKTVNVPNDARREDIAAVYLLAYRLGCKGLTVYRDGSRQKQVLNRGSTQLDSSGPNRLKSDAGVLTPRPRPVVTTGVTEKIALGCNRTLYVTINEDEDGLCEVFLQMGKSGGCTASQSEAIGRLVSLALRSGIEIEAIIRQLKGIRCPSPSWHNGGTALSCSDGIAKSMDRHIGGQADNPGFRLGSSPKARTSVKGMPDLSPECPECGEILEPGEGCVVCRSCGYSECW